MPITEKATQRYHIDGRVSIALDALSEKQKQTVGGVLINRDRFVASTADRRKVRRISKSEPVYALSIPSGLNIIYKVSGDAIEVMDLMGRATLRRYAPKKRRAQPKAAKRSSGVKGSI